jgi:hypothetical protein
MLCAAPWAPAENDGCCDIMFAVRRKALVPANETPGRCSLVRWETEPALVLSATPLVREANARVNDRVILRESDVGKSLDVIHSTFGCLNSASSRRRGRQKSVSPSEEELRLRGLSNGLRLLADESYSPTVLLLLPVHPATTDSTQKLRLPVHQDRTLRYNMRKRSSNLIMRTCTMQTPRSYIQDR